MIADESIDVVVSNCVLNLVDAAEKEELFREIFRVLKVGGRAVISDIVSDEPVRQHMRDDAELWSGCISGAFQELEFLKAFKRCWFPRHRNPRVAERAVANGRRDRVSIGDRDRLQEQRSSLHGAQRSGHVSWSIQRGARRRRARVWSWRADGGVSQNV